jgi:uncharacterized RDD family membrane protein YckC
MEVWIIQNGEKTGPFHDFDVRRKIESGELTADNPAWHEGQPAWLPLGEINLFSREFDLAPAWHEPHAVEEQTVTPPPLPAKPYSMRRFWARWFDLCLFSGVWWLAIWLAGRDIIAVLNHPWIMLLHYVPWFVLETLLIHRYGTTPGKWLLGLRVSNDNGSLPSLAEATRRSARVLFIGLGFGWLPLAVICQIMAWFTVRRIGRPLWDHAGGHQVTAEPLHPLRLVSYVLTLFIALMLQAMVVFPSLWQEALRTSPELKQQWEHLQKPQQR